MCLSGSVRKSLQVRPRCHRQLEGPRIQHQSSFFTEKLSSIGACNWCLHLQLVQRKQTANKSRKILHTSYPFQIKFPPIDLNVYCINSLVSCQETCKYLRVYLDFKLNFLHHIRQVESKVAKAVGILSKLRSLLPKSTLFLLYHAFIHPHLIYALPLWGCTFSSYL